MIYVSDHCATFLWQELAQKKWNVYRNCFKILFHSIDMQSEEGNIARFISFNLFLYSNLNSLLDVYIPISWRLSRRFSANIYSSNVNSRSTIKYVKLTKKTPKRIEWRRSSFFIVGQLWRDFTYCIHRFLTLKR